MIICRKWIKRLQNKWRKHCLYNAKIQFSSVQFTQSCPNLCNLMDCSTPGFCVYHQLLEITQNHVHRVGDDIQPSLPLLSPSPAFSSSVPASGSFPMSQFFTSGGQSIGVSTSESVLPVNIQDSFPLGLTGLISFSPKDSQESSTAPQFKSINSLVLSFPYGPTLTSICDYWKNHSFD